MVTVYTKSNCVQCDQTKRFLDKHNYSYEIVDLQKDAAAMDMVTNLGFSSAPVVITDDDKWSGFRLEKLKALTAV